MSTGTIRTLVVDDCESFAEQVAETLTKQPGIDATFQQRADATLDWLADADVDCIVSDSGTDGLDFLATVRERDDEIPCILLIDHTEEEVGHRALASGVADALVGRDVVEDDQYDRLANRIESAVARQQTTNRYERLVESSPDAIAHVGESGAILSANAAMAERVDTDHDDLVGRSLTDVFADDIGERHLAAGREAIETQETVRTEDARDGRSVDNRFVPVQTDRAQDSFHLLSRDITPRKECEEELQREAERLEDFTSVVSHDLRNPLNVAQSSVELVRDELDNDHVDRLERSLNRMDDIIDDALLLARQGDSVDQPSPVDLETMAWDAWSQTDTGEMELVVDYEGRIEADADRLKQILEDLFENALEHGDASTVTVGRVQAVDAFGDGDFYVADDGEGIPASHSDEIFETGFSTARGGTGLGLSIVSEIAEAHDWTVTVSESASGGARFDISGVVDR